MSVTTHPPLGVSVRSGDAGRHGQLVQEACVRCSLLRPDPAQRSRLEEIHDHLEARIIETKREGWLGEVEGLQVS
ncbi:hypothetical protein [Nocardia salmonicida]|uniref:hypothetical protein n=1 Tax=Nocardia salmonicida TaxID=53431 RepID=UPI0013F4C35F|nr:hypothetical protein [Nocardia salmonicida]